MISYLNRRRTTAGNESHKPTPELHSTTISDLRAKSSIDKELGELGENWDEQPEEMKDRKHDVERAGNEDEIQATPSHWGRRDDSTEEVFRSILGEESDGELDEIRDVELAKEHETEGKEEVRKQDEVQDPEQARACQHVTFRVRVSDVT